MPPLDIRQSARKNLIERCLRGEISTLDAAILAGRTRRAIQKTLSQYRSYGDRAFIHGNTGRSRQSEKYKALERNIADIFLSTTIDGKNPFKSVTYQFFTEILAEYYGINVSVNFVKRILKKLGHTSPVRHRCRKNETHHLLRPRKESTGELVQADGTEFDWFMTGKKYVIQGFVDDATGYPVGLYMTKNECLLGYIEAARNMLTREGIPVAIYPDKCNESCKMIKIIF